MSSIIGFVGGITGIVGMGVSILSYRKISHIKSLDIRLKIETTINSARENLKQLNNLIEDANRSRVSVAAAIGMGRSGVMQKWEKKISEDKTQIAELASALSGRGCYRKFNLKKLESEFIEIDKILLQVNGLIEKYRATMQEDDERRRDIREDHNNRK